MRLSVASSGKLSGPLFAIALVLSAFIFSPMSISAQDNPILFRVNAGGEADGDWETDTDALPSPYLLSGSANIETIGATPTLDASVPDGTPLSLFETKRIDANQPEPFMEWTFSPDVGYGSELEVRLFFIEMSRCSAGSRVFDVEIDGVIVEENLDVYAAAGNQCNVGIMRTYTVPFTGLTLSIRFPLENGKPSIVSAIEVIGSPPFVLPPLIHFAGCNECYQGSIDDGKDAIRAGMAPYDVDFDSQGNAYIADEYNFRVRKVDAETNIISTFIDPSELKPPGAGVFDDFTAYGLVIDSADNLYVMTSGSLGFQSAHYILKKDAVTGAITVFAGNGTSNYTGDGGPATDAGLGFTQDLSIDASDNLYITDRTHHVVRKIDHTTGIIETIAGNGTEGFSGDGGLATDAQLDEPQGVAVDSQGNIVFTDNKNYRIRKIDASTGVITTIAGNGVNASTGDDGPANSAELADPKGIAFDAFDNLYLSEFDATKVRRIDALTNIITTLLEYPFPQYKPRNLIFEGEDLYLSVQDNAVYYYDFPGDSGTSSLSVSPLSIAFEATVSGGTSNAFEVVLTNEGTSQISITDIHLSGNDPGDFSFVPNASSTIDGGSTLSFDAFFTPVQSASPQPLLITTGDPLYRINAGGELESDFTLDWEEDTDLNPSAYLIPGTANIETDTPTPAVDASVPVETPVNVFTTMRIDANKADPVMAWDFPVTPGEAYEVRFYFVEMSRCSVANRVFDVEIEGTVVIDNLDIYNEAGACNVGIMRSATATSDDETLSITFPLENGKPATIAAIEVMGPDALTPIFKSAQLNIEHTGANPALAVALSGEVDQTPGDNTLPVASFTVEVDGLQASFTDTSTDSDGVVSSWSWDFGDGNVSSVQHPVHNYAEEGTYTVVLTITDNEAGTHSFSTDIVALDLPQNVVYLSMPDTTYALGSSGVIPVWTTDVTGKDISNYSYTIAYDTTYMEVTGVDFSGTIVATTTPPSVTLTVPGEVKVSWGYVYDISGEGVFAYLEADFHTAGTSPLTFAHINFASGEPDGIGIDGSVTVASDTSAVTLTLPEVTHDVNTSGVIPVTVSDVNVKDIKSFSYTISYDPAVIDITGADFTGSIIPTDTPPTLDISTPGEIVINWSGATALEGEGLFANLEVDFLAVGASPLTLSNVVFNSGVPGSIHEDGSVSVSAGTGPFLEVEGMVVMEAENAHENNPGIEHAWEEQTDLTGFVGSTYMATTPDINSTFKTDALDQTPELKFDVEFSTPGSYAVWVRMAAPNTKGNTLHVGFENEPHPVQSGITTGVYDAWTWKSLWKNPDLLTFEVSSPGLHTIHVWMREDGVLIDRVLFSLDHSFVPLFEGPLESPRLGPDISSMTTSFKSDQISKGIEVPEEYALKGNYPNPFNPTTTIQYALPEAATVSLVVYDMMGREVATLVESEMGAGHHEVQWNAQTDAGTRVSSGIYLYRLRAGSFEQVRRMVLMK